MSLGELDRPLQGGDFDWPFFGLQSDIRPALALAARSNSPAAIATLYAADGGTPMGLGAQMVMVGESLTGFLSGGCIEADVALHAREVLNDGAPKRLVYGEGGPVDIQLPCGSRIEILVERVNAQGDAVQSLLELTEARRAAFWLSDGLEPFVVASERQSNAPEPFKSLLSRTNPGVVCTYQADPFQILRGFAPPIQLIVVGADPVALAVVKLADQMGIGTSLVRPRGPKSCPLPVRYFRGEIDEALDALRPDRWTAIAVLSHDAEVENAALTAALATEAGYVGALGSRRRMPLRNLRLQSAGFDDDEIGRIHAPIGLPLGGSTPWSIALSVVAEITAELA